jgi:hypothetical protein
MRYYVNKLECKQHIWSFMDVKASDAWEWHPTWMGSRTLKYDVNPSTCVQDVVTCILTTLTRHHCTLYMCDQHFMHINNWHFVTIYDST